MKENMNNSKYKKIQLIKIIFSNYCFICFESSVQKCDKKLDVSNILFLDCNHAFHKKCIIKWIKKYNNCPMCKIYAFLNKTPN